MRKMESYAECQVDACERKVNSLEWNFFIYYFVIFRTILLSVISLLNEPNTCSPANVDASIMYRRWRDSKGKDTEYENIIK